MAPRAARCGGAVGGGAAGASGEGLQRGRSGAGEMLLREKSWRVPLGARARTNETERASRMRGVVPCPVSCVCSLRSLVSPKVSPGQHGPFSDLSPPQYRYVHTRPTTRRPEPQQHAPRPRAGRRRGPAPAPRTEVYRNSTEHARRGAPRSRHAASARQGRDGSGRDREALETANSQTRYTRVVLELIELSTAFCPPWQI
jgi:hypothetical protein